MCSTPFLIFQPHYDVFKFARSSLNLLIFLFYPLVGLFEYLLIFWLHRHLMAKQVLNSKQSAKEYERMNREILRRSGYFSTYINFVISKNICL